MIAPSLGELVEEIGDLVEEPADRADPRAEGVRCALEAARSLLVGRPGHGPVDTEMDKLRRGLAAARAAVAAATAALRVAHDRDSTARAAAPGPGR